MYAVIATGGKQFKVEANSLIDIERVSGEPGSKIVFDKVLAVGEKSDITFGSPLVENAVVEGEIIKNYRGPKLLAFKMKRRKGYRKMKGHRQELTQVKITNIEVK